MRIGLIDVDNYERISDCFPNLVLMKLSAWHKANGDLVEWYHPSQKKLDEFFIQMGIQHSEQPQQPMNVQMYLAQIEQYDIVYMSKVFSFTDDYIYPIHANKIVRGVRILHPSSQRN